MCQHISTAAIHRTDGAILSRPGVGEGSIEITFYKSSTTTTRVIVYSFSINGA